MWHKPESYSKKGYTLIELLIGIAILGIVSVVFVAVLSTQQANYLEQTKRNALAINAQSVIRPIQLIARGGSSVIASSTITQGTYTTDADTVVMQLPSVEADGDVLVNEFDIIVIDRDPGAQENLRFIVSPDPQSSRAAQDRLLATTVNDFLVRYSAENPALSTFIDLTFELQEQYRDRTLSETYSFLISLRNSS